MGDDTAPALGTSAATVAYDDLERALEQVAMSLDDQTRDRASSLLDSLVDKLPEGALMMMLVRAVRTSESRAVRESAVYQIGYRMRDHPIAASSEVFRALEEALGDREASVRFAAARTLPQVAQRPVARAEEVLVDLLYDSDRTVAMRALEAYGAFELADRGALMALRAWLRADDELAQGFALMGIRRLGIHAQMAVDDVVAMLEGQRNPVLALMTLRELDWVGRPGAVSAMRQCMQSPWPHVRLEALATVAGLEIIPDELLAHMRLMHQEDESPAVRAEVGRILERL